MPSHLTTGDQMTRVTSTFFSWSFSPHINRGYNQTTLLRAFDRYEQYAFGAIVTGSGSRSACARQKDTGGNAASPPSSSPLLTGLTVEMGAGAVDAPLRMHGDEAYELEVPVAGVAVLRANSTAGALRGLETFHQLLQFGLVKEGNLPTEILLEDTDGLHRPP